MTERAHEHQAYDLAVLEELLARLVATLPGCLAGLLVDCQGDEILLSPPQFADRSWVPPKPIAQRRAFTTHRTRLGHQYCCYEIPLLASDGKQSVGALHLRFRDHDPKQYQDAIDSTEEILDCIRKYMMISREISSVRLTGLSPQDNITFLAALDRQIAERPAFAVVPRLLELCRRHLSASLVALSCPALNQLVTAPAADRLAESQRKDRLRALAGLHTQAVKSHRVIVSDEPRLLESLTTDGLRGQVVVSLPITTREASSIASLTVVSREQMARTDVQLLRAVAVKVSGLLMRPGQSQRENNRIDLIERIDTDIRLSPSATRCLMKFDIDRMHVINDRLGHRRGDDVIGAVEKAANQITRERGGLTLCNGNVGYLYLPESDYDVALDCASRLQAKVAMLTADDMPGTSLTLSIGIAIIPEHAHDGSQAFNVAELALRSAKSRGGKQALVYQNLDASIVQRRSDLAEISNLQSALLNDRFVLHAQRIQGISGDSRGERFEILTRMIGNDNELIQPVKFLSAAERYQMMPAVDRWVVTRTLEQLSSAENVLEINFSTYSINVAAQTLADKDFVDFLLAAITNAGLSPDCLCFEITESTAIRSFELAEQFVRSVQQIGCSVALDDFGAGYCSFGYLESLPVDLIKLDGRFIRNLCQSPLNEAIVKAVVSIADVIHAETVAEFVQDDMTLARLAELGVTYAQGFGVSQPEPLENILGRMESPLALGLTGTISTPRQQVS